MKAVIWTGYGEAEVLQLQEVAKPSPKADEVLVRIAASQVSAGDCEMRALKLRFPFRLPMRLYVGMLRPQRVTVLGQDLSGEVDAVGSAVQRFKPGDLVYGTTGFRFGAHAEYVCLPADADDGALALKPASLSHSEAACLPVSGMEALGMLRQADIHSGERLLINGAGGGIGTVALQIARHAGAEVSVVDAGDKLERLKELGAAHVIDYMQQDFTRLGQRYDVILDVVGTSDTTRSLGCLNPGGRYLVANPGMAHLLRGHWGRKPDGKRVIFGAERITPADLDEMTRLVESGVVKPVVDRMFPLEQAVEAHRYVESGMKLGCVVLRMEQAAG